MPFRKNKIRREKVIRTLSSTKDSSVSEPTSNVVPQVISEDEVPAGTVPEILGWVGEDVVRAQKALDSELESDKPRKGLVSSLTDLIDSEADSDDDAESTD